MLANAKFKRVHELLADLSREEIIWLNGYLAGLVSKEPPTETQAAIAPPAAVPTAQKITLAYGTETGNAKKLATALAAKAKKAGVLVKLVSLDQYKLTDLEKEEHFFVVVSTQGEGEPPIGAKKFYDFLFDGAPSLGKLQYAVLGLGDTAYPLFCKTAEDVDGQLQKLGAKKLLPVRRCDVDYDADADAWFDAVLATVKDTAAPTNGAAVKPVTTNLPAAPKPKGKKYYEGTILTNINLNGRGSEKRTFHIEIGVDEAVDYEPGDSLAVVPQNRKAVVDEIISLTGIDPQQEIIADKFSGTVEELLTSNLNICHLLTSTVKAYGEITGQQIPDTRMDLKDLLRIYPVKDAAQFAEVIKILKSIAPRLYSISSSPAAHGSEVHLTVAKHRFVAGEEEQYGLCSEFLGDLPVGSTLRFYIHKTRSFKLPAPNKDIIMIGPGTGVAPFRSFVAERDALGAGGRSWLFFGDRSFTTDFLYQTDWQAWMGTGSLTKMNVAFSRDGEQKLYVQHKMMQQSKELFDWLEAGALVYLCGNKGPMNTDVENAIVQVVKEHKGVSDEEATAYFENLKKTGRYIKEVY